MIYESENDADGILEVMRNLHQYVPHCGEAAKRKYEDQGVIGDQLTIERAVNGHVSLANGFTPEERLDGLHFEIADWHSGNRFLEVHFSHVMFCLLIWLFRNMSVQGPTFRHTSPVLSGQMMKTLNWSVGILGCECKLFIQLNITRVVSKAS